MDRPELKKKIDKAVKGRLMSIETLAWNRQYNWEEKDKIIREHLEYIRKDLLALIPDEEEIRLNEYKKWVKTASMIFEEAEKPCQHYEGIKWVKRCCDECWQDLKSRILGGK